MTLTDVLAIFSVLLNAVILVWLMTQNVSRTVTGLQQSLKNVEQALDRQARLFHDEWGRWREQQDRHAQETRVEFGQTLVQLEQRLLNLWNEKFQEQRHVLEQSHGYLRQSLESQAKRLDGYFQDSAALWQTQNQAQINTLAELGHQQRRQLDGLARDLNELTRTSEQKLETMRQTVEAKLTALQTDNAAKLELMRQTVDEKLHQTLEQRLGESFKLVSDRLELVQKGLGEMQTLAQGVGDLKRVLTNVKTRGTLGEIQLESLLDQILAPEQYQANVTVMPGQTERVDFAIRLPGSDEHDEPIWLPIDAKFPLEDYQRLVEAEANGDLAGVQEAAKWLETRIKTEAKSIRDKYIQPPHTTDFAILFLPLEGLFAEVLRRPGLFETLQREYRVVLTGPTTITAFLQSLQMGFRTLAIQKRSSEVWKLLGAVKTEFGKFGAVLEKTQKKLQEASHTIDQAATRTRAIERTLRSVEAVEPSTDPGWPQLEV